MKVGKLIALLVEKGDDWKSVEVPNSDEKPAAEKKPEAKKAETKDKEEKPKSDKQQTEHVQQ